jgi:hypothetical protein
LYELVPLKVPFEHVRDVATEAQVEPDGTDAAE